MATVSYANNREDILLARAFGPNHTGFYIDVGANYPEQESVTKLFYDRGWSGINVEPASEPFAALVRERPRDVNLKVGLAQHPGEATFYEYGPGFSGRSTFDEELTKRYRDEDDQEPAAHTIPVTTLAAVWEEHVGDRVVDFLKIDVEGNEEAVLRGADFSRLRPRVVIVEATAPGSGELTHEAWEPLLLEHSYRLALFEGLNRVYVDESEPELAERLSVPVNVFDDYEPVAMTEQREVWLSTHRHAAKLERENKRLSQERSELQAEAEHLANIRVALEDALAYSERDASTARTMVSTLRAELEASRAAHDQALIDLDAARTLLAASQGDLLALSRSWTGRLLLGVRALRQHLSAGFRSGSRDGMGSPAVGPVPACAIPVGSPVGGGYDPPMSWKVTARQALGWPLRRALNPRFDAVAHEIAQTRGTTHAEAEATRQLAAAIERSISEAIDEQVQSVIEVAANVGDRLDRALVVLERIESRLDALAPEQLTAQNPAE